MQTARDLMRRQVIAVAPQTLAEAAVDRLIEHDISGVPVVDQAGRIVGMFSEIDRIQRGSLEGQSVEHLMSTQVVSVDANDSLDDVARIFKRSSVRRLPVTEDGLLVGIIGLRDLVRYVRETERALRGSATDAQDWKLIEPRCASDAN